MRIVPFTSPGSVDGKWAPWRTHGCVTWRSDGVTPDWVGMRGCEAAGARIQSYCGGLKCSNMLRKVVTLAIVYFTTVTEGCQSGADRTVNDKYQEDLRRFNFTDVAHFPTEIRSDSSLFAWREITDWNTTQFFLYEFVIPASVIESIELGLADQAYRCQASDACIVVPHRKETLSSFETLERVAPLDAATIVPGCIPPYHAIPRFIDYPDFDGSRSTGLDTSFTLYVLKSYQRSSASETSNWPGPESAPPSGEWTNGYSMGVAVSHSKSTVIYWTTFW